MTITAGTIDGSDVGLAIETAVPDTYADIGGITTNSMTINNGVIDTTNKGTAGWREIMDGAGLQSIDMTLECVFNSEANFILMRDANLSQTLTNYQYVRGGETITGSFKIASWAETSPDNDKLTASVSLQSAGEPVIT
jgi:predicted secreted protein